MKITYNGTTLADVGSPASVPAANAFEHDGVRVVQDEPLVRAVNQGSYARSNHKSTITFTTATLFTSVDAAQAYCADQPGALPDSGDLVMISLAGSRSRTMTGAKLRKCHAKYTGMTAITHYEFTGPHPVTTP